MCIYIYILYKYILYICMPHLKTRSTAVFLWSHRKKMSPPEVIDEIGSASEVEAACSIGFRGIVLVATAHACSLQEAMNNPTLQPLYLAINLGPIGALIFVGSLSVNYVVIIIKLVIVRFNYYYIILHMFTIKLAVCFNSFASLVWDESCH